MFKKTFNISIVIFTVIIFLFELNCKWIDSCIEDVICIFIDHKSFYFLR